MMQSNHAARLVRSAVCVVVTLALAPVSLFAQAADHRVAASDSDVKVKPGDLITSANKDTIQNLIPPMYWPYFAYDGMQVKIAPTRHYELDKTYMDLTEKNAAQVKIGPRGELVGYAGGGFPFPPGSLDASDPLVGVKVAWNYNCRWMGSGMTLPTMRIPFYDKNNTRFREMTAYYRRTYFSDRVDDLGRQTLVAGDTSDVEWKEYFVIWSPFDVKDTEYVIVRYNNPERMDEAWAYLPTLRRVRKVPASQRSDSLLGLEHTLDDFYGSNAKISTMDWKYIGEGRVLAVVNTKKYPFPVTQEYTHGPSGVSLANGDEFEVRRVHVIERIPRDPNHPYSRQRMYIDAETFFIFYSETWDRKGDPYKFWTLAHSYTAEDPYIDQGKASLKKSLVEKILIVGNVQTGKRQTMEWGNSNYDLVSSDHAQKEFAVSRLKEGR